MADIDTFKGFDLGEVQTEGFERGLELTGCAVGDLGPGLLAANVEAADVGVLRAPAMDLYVDLFRKLAGQVIDVDTGPPIDVGREFAGEERCFHACFLLNGEKAGSG